MLGPKKMSSFGKVTRAREPAVKEEDEDLELQQRVQKHMQLPTVDIQSKDCTENAGEQTMPSAEEPPPSEMPVSPGASRFTVDTVSSRKNSEDQRQRRSGQDTKQLIERQLSEAKAKLTSPVDGPPDIANGFPFSRHSGIGEMSTMTVPNDDVRKTSDAPSVMSQGSQPKSRKVSFYGDVHPSETVASQTSEPAYPGYVIIPDAASRRISAESYYGIPPSRKTSLDAFYYPHHGHGIPHPKISIFSVQSTTDSEKTFRDTHEALPHADHYRDMMSVYDLSRRPTLFQLRELDKLSEPRSPGSVQTDLLAHELTDDVDEEAGGVKPEVSSGLKFGWITGVLVRCLLNIFGVMLFLRLTWITGQAGIGLTSVVIMLSGFVTTITTMSMSAICTNGEVKGGGAYYMISRSLGPEFGGSIGIIFSLANAVAAAMYVVGFAETVRDLMWEYDAQITGDMLHEVRIIGIITCCLLVAIVMIGMEWEAKAQLGLLFILTVAIINFVIGTFIPSSDDETWKGVTGYNAEVFRTNFVPGFTEGNNFFSVFSIFFPAATGILAGANISGDLKDPQKAIPKGTFLAILITSGVYLVMTWMSGACIVRDAIGPLGAMVTYNISGNLTSENLAPTLENVANCSQLEDGCQYGLLNDNGAVGLASAFRPLILAGIFSATLSSALASLVGAPKVFQALGKDKLFPFIHFFAKGAGKNQEPKRGFILAFFICVAMTCIGSLDLIAPIISNFFLMSYALINYSCFDSSIANSPGFRPAFQYYNKWFSLLGSLLCLAIMFLINWWSALITLVIVAALFMYIKVTKPDVNWGSSTQANAYREALKTSLKLTSVEEHVKNFRPQILVLTGFPRNRAALVDFASSITKKQSLLICGHVFQGELSEHLKRLRSTAAYRWFKARKTKSFYNSVAAPTFRVGVQVLLQALGLGKMRPNTVFLGFKADWQKADPRDVLDYYNVVQDAFDLNYGVGILRVPEGFDRNKVPDELLDFGDDDEMFYGSEEDDGVTDDDEAKEDSEKAKVDTVTTQEEEKPISANCPSRKLTPFVTHYEPTTRFKPLKRLNTLTEGLENAAFEPEEVENQGPDSKPPLSPTASLGDDKMMRFKDAPQYGTIDVWWLFDDGGLTLLIPYILSQRKQWKNCKLRVFCVGTKKGNINEDQLRMASLLSKFRIDYSQLTVIPDLSKKPQLTTYREFELVIHKWRLRSGEYQEDYLWKIADADLIAHKQKTYRNIRLREQLMEHSKEASLVVMTLPMPRKEACPAGLYMGWLEMLTRDMPPILLLRGNQQSVLTYYS